LSFDTTGDASFSHWLSTVVFNLCVDWHRAEYGRATVIPAIAALPAFDRTVYRMCHEQGQSRDECFQTLKADFPELTVEGVTNSLQRIHRFLTPRQRWQIGVRGHRRLGTQPGSRLSSYEHAFDPGEGPEALAAGDEELLTLHTALRQSSPEHRLLLHLRYQEGLTFQQIAAIGDYGNARRARRQVKRAMEELQKSLEKQQGKKNRKT
jgi:RNA polymerase sigma factor (sigma-70 family)